MMTAREHPETVRETVAVFHRADDLENAVADLESSGFDRRDISLLASQNAVKEKLGHAYREIGEAKDDPRAPRAAFVSKASVAEGQGLLAGMLAYIGAAAATGAVVASGGTAAAIIGAAAATGGATGLAGAALAKWIGDKRANYLQEQLDRGGILLWVRTPDPDTERRAHEIFQRHHADDVHAHELPAAA